jgi:hypothetical protein
MNIYSIHQMNKYSEQRGKGCPLKVARVSEATSFRMRPFLEKGLEVIGMPGFDRTGPQGAGPMTGRGMGYCNSYPGTRAGFGIGRGLGRRRFFRGQAGLGRSQPARYAPVQYVPAAEYTRDDEIADLRAEKELAQRDLESIKQRLRELEKDAGKEKK